MITEVNIKEIEAKRAHKDLIANMKFNINFDDVKVDKENVSVDFTFTTDYEGQESSKNIGKLEIKGNIDWKDMRYGRLDVYAGLRPDFVARVALVGSIPAANAVADKKELKSALRE